MYSRILMRTQASGDILFMEKMTQQDVSQSGSERGLGLPLKVQPSWPSSHGTG